MSTRVLLMLDFAFLLSIGNNWIFAYFSSHIASENSVVSL
jgi:hypothetical protein